MIKNIFLIRHVESTKNLNDLFGDDNSIYELTEKGESDSIKLTNNIKCILESSNNDFQFLSSPDMRSFATTRIITKIIGCDYKIVNSLIPIKAGKLSGISEEQADKLFPELMNQKRSFREGKISGYHISYPDGENVYQFQNRILEDFNNIISQSYKTFFIVTHQSIITSILSYFQSKMNNQVYYYYYKLDLGSISKVTINEVKYEIEYVNRV